MLVQASKSGAVEDAAAKAIDTAAPWNFGHAVADTAKHEDLVSANCCVFEVLRFRLYFLTMCWGLFSFSTQTYSIKSVLVANSAGIDAVHGFE
jgi:hypothetical protein